MDVTIRCTCPPKADGEPRHAQDTVVLRDVLSPRARRALIYDLSLLGDEGTMGDKLATLNEGYVLRGVESWTLVDEKGKAIPVTPAMITEQLIDRPNDVVATAADDLYTEVVLLPLLLGASSYSPSTPTAAQMSAATNGQTPQRKPSKRSSTSTTPMVVTGPTLLSNGGGSSSSAS
jgi:hypothetical protein